MSHRLAMSCDVAYGSVDDVVKNVRTFKCDDAKWRIYMAPTHKIQDNSPMENVVAAYETGRKYGIYR